MTSMDDGSKLIDKIAKIVAKQSRVCSDGEIRSLHKAMDWIREASKELEKRRKKS